MSRVTGTPGSLFSHLESQFLEAPAFGQPLADQRAHDGGKMKVLSLRPSGQPRPLTPASTHSSLSDVEIVAGMARGESWAADALYDRVHSVVDRSLRRVLRSNQIDYDDLLQSVFERLIVSMTERPLSSNCNLVAWSCVIATRVAIDLLRRRARERRLFSPFDQLEIQNVPDGLEREIEARSSVMRFQRILGRMSRKYAETVIMHDVLGHDLAAIAATTETSVAAAQSRLVRGRKELLSRLREEGLGP